VPVDRRQLHEEVVRMLAVVQRRAAVGLAALEQERKLQLSAHGRGSAESMERSMSSPPSNGREAIPMIQ